MGGVLHTYAGLRQQERGRIPSWEGEYHRGRCAVVWQIATSTPPISVMPPMLGILTKTEIRDVVAYLASLKAKK